MTEPDGPAAHQDAPARVHHDMGGVTRFLCEPIDTTPHALSEFGREKDALRQILGRKGVMSMDSVDEAGYRERHLDIDDVIREGEFRNAKHH